MNVRRVLIGVLIAAVVAVAAWFGYRGFVASTTKRPAGDTVSIAVPDASSARDVVTVDDDSAISVPGATPMAERVAVIAVLNKRNGETREFRLKPGQGVRIGNAIVRLRACERTAPWEPEQLTGAFVQLIVRQADNSAGRAFSGWVYAERPALNMVRHPIYDVWPKSCAMTFPETGPDTVSAGSAPGTGSAPSRSSANQSPSTDGAPTATPPADSPSEALSNAI